MPKKKKTRKQKVVADTRQHTHQNAVQTQPTPTYSMSTQTPILGSTVQPTHSTAISYVDYSYLAKELLKTVSVTVAIVIAESVLYMLTKGVL
jgi:hypothetical protein